MKNSVIDIFSTVLTAIQTNEVVETICGILTIISISIGLVLKLIDWYKKTKADGKVTIDEVKEGINIVNEGVEELSEEIKEK